VHTALEDLETASRGPLLNCRKSDVSQCECAAIAYGDEAENIVYYDSVFHRSASMVDSR
jgi:hypothetical protein